MHDHRYAKIYPDTRFVNAEGPYSAMATTSGDTGSINTASGNRGVIVVINNGPNTQTCVNCVSPGVMQHATVGPGSASILQFNNAHPEKGPARVSVEQFGSGAVTAMGLNNPII